MAGRDDTHRLGWLGIGRMGMEMGRRLLEAGCDLAVFNRSMSKAEPLIRLGAKPAGSAAELAARDIVFITVGSSDDLISAVLGPDGLMSASRGGPPGTRRLLHGLGRGLGLGTGRDRRPRHGPAGRAGDG